jgi:hypothetical protein
MIGLETPGPGSGVFQARFAVGDQVVGSESESRATPEPSLPRKAAQSPASNAKHETSKAANVENRRKGIVELANN